MFHRWAFLPGRIFTEEQVHRKFTENKEKKFTDQNLKYLIEINSIIESNGEMYYEN